jgi:hypothetical protein
MSAFDTIFVMALRSLSFQKQPRIKNPELLKKLRKFGCFICNDPVAQVHHLQSRGAHGDDIPENCIPLCFQHHMAIHNEGIKTFSAKHDLPISWDSGWPRLTFTWSI